MSRPRVNASQFSEKWARRTQAAVPDYQSGVAAVTESPTEKAAASQTKMLTNLTAAVTSGKWGRRLKAVSLEDWRKKVLEVGAGRISAGVTAAKADVEKMAGPLLAHIEVGMNAVDKLADLTIEDSVNRAATFIRHMGKFQRAD